MKILKILLLVFTVVFPTSDTTSKTFDNTNIGLEMFMDDIGYTESGGRYNIVNQYGYMGKYQFSPKTLRSIGIKTTQRQFLNNPKLQDEAMITLLKQNKKTLQQYIEVYDGNIVKNYVITESGILAAAHLAGSGNVQKYFKTGRDFKDGNGTALTYYMIKFSGYQLNI